MKKILGALLLALALLVSANAFSQIHHHVVLNTQAYFQRHLNNGVTGEIALNWVFSNRTITIDDYYDVNGTCTSSVARIDNQLNSVFTLQRQEACDSTNDMNWCKKWYAIDEEGLNCRVIIGKFHNGQLDEGGRGDYDYFKVVYNNVLWLWDVTRDASQEY